MILSENEMEIKVKKCGIDDLDKIIEIGTETYHSTFSKYCSKEVMNSYLEEAFDRNRMLFELSNKNSHFYFAFANNQLAGYLKINIDDAQCDLKDKNGLEIERIYVKDQFKRNGIGIKLINIGIEKAIVYKKEFVWLGVWEKNKTAIGFYKKNGFVEIGTHSFRMGDEMQNDYIMKKDINLNKNYANTSALQRLPCN